MKRLIGFAFLLATASFGQSFVPPPASAYIWNGSTWNGAPTTATAGAVTFVPPPAALYCFNTSLNKWVPADSSCFGGGGGGSGTVTSVTFTGDGILDSSTPSTAVTTSGTVTATPLTKSANTVLAGPTTGSAANPAFRALVTADIPTGTSGATIPLLNTANTWTLSQTMTALLTANAGLAMPTGQAIAWNSDTSVSRLSAGVVAIGTGASGSVAGSAEGTGFIANGSGLNSAGFSASGFFAGSAKQFSWSSTTTYNSAQDTTLCRSAAGIVEVNAGAGCGSSGTIDAAVVEGGAFTQQAANNTGGTCTMTTTSCTITIAHTYTTPVCIVTQQSATLTGGAAGCTVSGTTVTITSAVSNTETWGALVFGNPN